MRWVLAAEVQPVVHLLKRTMQGEFDVEHPVSEMVTPLVLHASQGLRAGHCILVVMATLVEDAPEPVGHPRCVERHTGAERADHAAGAVDQRRPGMRQHGFRVFVERLDAPSQEVTRIEVVVRCALEQLSPGLLYQEGVIRDEADVALLADVTDTVVLPRDSEGRSPMCRPSMRCPTR